MKTKTSTSTPLASAQNLTSRVKSKAKRAFTLMEMLIAVTIIALISALVVPAIFDSKSEATAKSAQARAKVLNEARDRAIIVGLISESDWTNNYGSSAESTNAIMFLLTNNLIRYSANLTNN